MQESKTTEPCTPTLDDALEFVWSPEAGFAHPRWSRQQEKQATAILKLGVDQIQEWLGKAGVPQLLRPSPDHLHSSSQALMRHAG